jgi:hypothetical protein
LVYPGLIAVACLFGHRHLRVSSNMLSVYFLPFLG